MLLYLLSQLSKKIKIKIKITIITTFQKNVHVNIKMVCYQRTDVSEGIDVNKTRESKEYDICHYQYFLDKRFGFQMHVCNVCYNLLMMSVNLDDISILNINGI